MPFTHKNKQQTHNYKVEQFQNWSPTACININLYNKKKDIVRQSMKVKGNIFSCMAPKPV